MGVGTTEYMAMLGRSLHVRGAAGCWTVRLSTNPQQGRVHRLRDRTLHRVVCGLLYEGRTTEIAMGAALIL